MSKEEKLLETALDEQPVLVSWFINNQPVYQELCNEISYILKKKLSAKEIEFSAVTSRVKTLKSFLEKVNRKNYRDPYKELTDFAGVRVVYLYRNDLSKIEDVLKSEFELIEAEGKTDFGYQANHYLVKLGNRLTGARYDDIKDKICEIQVRTAAQDAWAVINHHLSYKQEADIPKELQVSLNDLSSIFKLADKQFVTIRNERENYRKEVAESSQDKFLTTELNFDSLTAYTNWKYPNLPVKEVLQTALLSNLDREKYKTLGDIDKVVEKSKAFLEVYSKENPRFFGFGTDYITKSLGFVDKEFRRLHRFSDITKGAYERHKHLIEN